MYLFCHTPLHQHSKFLAHRAEHVVGSSVDMLQSHTAFFDHLKYTDVGSNHSYTWFWIPDTYSASDYIERLCTPLDIEIIKNEKKLLKSEYAESSYHQELAEKVFSKLYGKPIKITTYSNNSIQDLISYHKKFYKPENFVVTDNTYNILSQTRKTTSICQPSHFNSEVLVGSLRYQSDAYTMLSVTLKHSFDLILINFLYHLINTYVYHTSKFSHDYWHSTPSQFFTDTYGVVLYDFDLNFSASFFEEFKKHYVSYVYPYEEGIKSSVLSELFLSTTVSDALVSDFVSSIDFDYITTLFCSR